MARFTVEWSVIGGGRGNCLFFASAGTWTSTEVQSFADNVRTFFVGVQPRFHTSVNWTFASEIVEVNEATGVIIGVQPLTAPASLSGSSSIAEFAAPAGALVRWETGQVVAGKRFRGRTFLVPLVRDAYDSVGTLQSATITTLQTAANTYLTNQAADGVTPMVYSRTHHTNRAITGAVIPDKVVILRSRRD
jgi:hypothetical protein